MNLDNNTVNPDARITELEIQLAHQDATIEDLNRTVTEQWAAIDRLTKEVEALKDRFKAMKASNIDDAPYTPPHY